MKVFIKAVGLTAVIATFSVMADEVDQSSINSFKGGDPALAAELNQNFNALITAINDNAQQIAELRSDLTSFDVTGKKYQLYKLRTNMPHFLNTELVTFTFEEGGIVNFISLDYDAGYSSAGTGDLIDVVKEFNSGSLSWQQTDNVVELLIPDEDARFFVSPGGRVLTSVISDDVPIGTTTRSSFGQDIWVGVEVPNP